MGDVEEYVPSTKYLSLKNKKKNIEEKAVTTIQVLKNWISQARDPQCRHHPTSEGETEV